MRKFTKGPWVFEPADGYTDEGRFVAGDFEICTFGDSETYYPSNGEAPSQANANLIAAAPDMYGSGANCDEAMHNLIELFRPFARDDVQVLALSLAVDALAELRAALAKANGETT